MKRIPIYDATADITCTLAADELTGRLDQIERLHAALTAVEHTDHGLLLHFPNHSDVRADVERFAADEKACCAFWGFEVSADGDELHLRWDGPPVVDELLDRLLAAFRSDEPLTAISGLL